MLYGLMKSLLSVISLEKTGVPSDIKVILSLGFTYNFHKGNPLYFQMQWLTMRTYVLLAAFVYGGGGVTKTSG